MKLSDLVIFNPKRPLKKGESAAFVEMAALPENGRDINRVDEKIFTGGGSKFANKDTLFARITPCLENGKTSLVSGLSDGEVAFGSTEFIVLAAKEPEYDSDYIYYLSRLGEFRSFARSRMEGTSGRQRVAWQSLADYEYDFPDKRLRKFAGDVLKKFDDKILLNHQINHTLEQMAQALFKSWFVDFEPVKAKITALEAGGSQEDAMLAAMTAISGKDSDALVVFEREHPEQYAQLKATAELFPSAMQESEGRDIPKGWAVVKTEELTSKIGMGPFGSNIKVSTFVDEGIPIISGQHLKESILNDGENNFITLEHADKLKSSNVFSEDIIFTHAGSIGQVSIIPEFSEYERYVISQRQFFLRADKKLRKVRISGEILLG
ncbi:restriction endonuclease subunit S [Escherichia coli]|nr:restriction endonuclease subunit S [Escherichia coli]